MWFGILNSCIRNSQQAQFLVENAFNQIGHKGLFWFTNYKNLFIYGHDMIFWKMTV